jgi:hypothetical protein
MALGILDDEDFEPAIVTLDTGPIRNLFFFSDGLIEQPNPVGEPFGMDRLMGIFENYDDKEPLVSRIVNEFSAFNQLGELLDDLSICDLQVQKLMEVHLHDSKEITAGKSGRLTVTLEIEGGMIASADIIGCIDSMMYSADMAGGLRQKAFTVFAELISNGLDHGILNLDSNLKNDFVGFSEYLDLKQQRLENIGENEKLSMKFAYSPSTSEIDFEILDTGKGYDMTLERNVSDDALSGRGLKLIKQLSKNVDIISPGNKTIVNLKGDN